MFSILISATLFLSYFRFGFSSPLIYFRSYKCFITIKLLKFAAAKNENLTAIKKATSKDEKIALGVALAKDIVEFKKQNPADFDELCELISELANIYESDEGVRKSISALM